MDEGDCCELGRVLITLCVCCLSFCQVGRSSESPIDFVVMDTLPGDKKDAKVMQSTISRFACRILVNRCEPAKAKIFAAGFDSSRNIFLGVSKGRIQYK